MGLLVDEALSQAPRVELLEHILVIQVFEDGYRRLQFLVDLVLADTFLGFFQKRVAILGQLKKNGETLQNRSLIHKKKMPAYQLWRL